MKSSMPQDQKLLFSETATWKLSRSNQRICKPSKLHSITSRSTWNATFPVQVQVNSTVLEPSTGASIPCDRGVRADIGSVPSPASSPPCSIKATKAATSTAGQRDNAGLGKQFCVTKTVFFINHFSLWAGIAQLVKWLAMDWTIGIPFLAGAGICFTTTSSVTQGNTHPPIHRVLVAISLGIKGARAWS